MVKSWMSVRDVIRSNPGTSPPHLHGRTERVEDSACIGKGQTKSDQEGKVFGVKSVYTPIQSREGCPRLKKKNGAGHIFLLQMGAKNSSLTPLNCILKYWDRFDPQGLKKTHLVFLCDTAWPRDPLKDGKRWPVGGFLKYNIVLQLDLFCKEQEKSALK